MNASTDTFLSRRSPFSSMFQIGSRSLGHAQERRMARHDSFHEIECLGIFLLCGINHPLLGSQRNGIVKRTEQVRAWNLKPRFNRQLGEHAAVGVSLQFCDPVICGAGAQVVVEDILWGCWVDDVALMVYISQ